MPLDKTCLDDYPLSLDKVAIYTGFSKSLIYKEVENGRLRSFKRGGEANVHRVYRSEVDRWIKYGSQKKES